MEIDEKLKDMMASAVVFHGHSCPGLAIGVVASKIALETAKRSADEELVAVVENDACGVDAIQALTGCTYGKGNLIHKDFGKSVYTFYNRDTGAALRLSLRPEVFAEDDETRVRSKELFDKVRAGTATEAEKEVHNKIWEDRINSILAKGDELFYKTEINKRPPEKARIFNDFICENCGEPAMLTRVCELNGKKYCIPCCKELQKEKETK